MEFDGLIFDIDGTLWNSTGACEKAFNRAMTHLGQKFRVSRQDIAGIMGLPHDEAYQKLFPGVRGEELQLIDKECFSEELEVLRNEGGDVYPGVGEGIKLLSQKVPLFLVSNCRLEYLETFLGCTGLTSYFKDHECFGNTGNPKGDNLMLICQRNKLSKAAYIGDTAGDHQAALKAGVKYFHVDYGFGEPIGECWRFGDFKELTSYFLEGFE